MSDVIKLSKEELEKLKEFKVKNDQIKYCFISLYTLSGVIDF